jgi:hypothetical protein
MRKVPHFDYLGSTGIKSPLHVPKGMKYNTAFFVESVVPDLVEHVCQESRPKMLRSIMIYLDSARLPNSRKSEIAHIAIKACRIPALVYSPDLSPNDFFIFGMLKERMSGTSYSSPYELISAVSELIASLLKYHPGNVYQNWIKCLNWVIKHGEYSRK